MFPIHCKLTHPEFGYSEQKKAAGELLAKNGLDHVYCIERMEVSRSNTSLYLQGINRGWNSVQFSPCDILGNLYTEPDYADTDLVQLPLFPELLKPFKDINKGTLRVIELHK